MAHSLASRRQTAAARPAHPAIEFNQVSVIYENEIRALSGVSTKIETGEFLFLSGPTGSGKSTFLKLIYRQLPPTEGRVYVEGVNVSTLPAHQVPLLRRKIGIVFEDFKLLEGRTVFENVAYALEAIGFSPAEVSRKAAKALERVGLLQKSSQCVDGLSAGEKQRTAIARAIANRPPLLLADEPTGHLDSGTGREIFEIFKKIHEEGTTILVATHNLAWAEQMNTRIIFLYNGENIENLAKEPNRLGFPNVAILPS